MPKSNPAPALSARSQPEQDFQTRAASLLLGRGAPSTLDPKTRSVELVIATETPVRVWDSQRWEEVDEVLLMSGLQPMPGQVPLLDSHSRFTTANVLGSARDIRRQGEQLIARAFFAGAPSGQQAFALVEEGHLTDNSVGYRVNAATWIESGRTVEIEGRQFTGPKKVVTNWSLKEVSLTPIGADEAAKVRAANHKREGEERTMNKELRAYLEKLGLAQDATDEEAQRYWAEVRQRAGAPEGERGHHREPAPAPAPPAPEGGGAPPAPPAGGGEDQRAQQAAQAERARAAEIVQMCRAHGVEDQAMADMVTSGKTPDQCGREILVMVAQRGGIGGGGGYRPPVNFEKDERDKFRAAALDGLSMRAGLPVPKPAPGHEELRGYTLVEMARESLRRAGQPTGGQVLDMVGRSLTTSDLPNVLADVANKSVMLGWEGSPETWPLWAAEGSTNDFKPGKEVRLGEFDDLDEMTDEDPEYTYGSLKDAMEQYAVATYGKAIRISRKLIINDDLNQLVTVAQAMGESASRKVGDVAWAALIGNSAMGDGKALFHADHSNIATIPAFDVDGLGLAIQKMNAQMDLRKKRRIRVPPTFFLAPTALYVTAEKFFGSEVIGTQAEPNIKNPFTGIFPQPNRVYEPRLDDFGANIFFLAGPKGRTVKVFFLLGNKTPYIDWQGDWDTDGRKGKVRIDVGAKAMDWRGLERVTITA
ncbi:MAG: hypothetical protein HY910_12090 [Desulfarculus sp.]|nr:hypothetical protein [Desulfarculus sp.]